MTHYVVTYKDAETDETVTLRARKVFDSPLGLSFIALADFVFDGGGGLLVNPGEEALARRMAKVRTLHLSIYRVLSIQEVGDEADGLALVRDRSNLVVFPQGR